MSDFDAARMTRLVSLEEAAAALGVSAPTIEAWQDRGIIDRADESGCRMVPVSDIERYQREQPERIAWRAELVAWRCDEPDAGDPLGSSSRGSSTWQGAAQNPPTFPTEWRRPTPPKASDD